MTPTISDPTLFVRAYNIRPRQCQTPRFSRETTISSPKHDTYNRIPYNLRPHAFRVRLQYQAPTMSVVTFLAQDYNIRPRTWHLQSQTPRFSCELTISGPDNVWLHAFRARLQYQAPNMTPTIESPTILDPTHFVWDYNIRPRQCRLLRFWRKTTISGPEHDTYNFRPHAFHASLQYQAPTMSDPTLFARDYNIKPQTRHLQS